MQKLFSSTNDFRANATDKDCETLYQYYFKEPAAAWKQEDCPYGFSKSSAKNLLIERGLMGTIECNDSKAVKRELPILTKSRNKQKFKQRSISLSDSTYQALLKAYDDYDLLPNGLVAESIMYAALAQYGYIEE